MRNYKESFTGDRLNSMLTAKTKEYLKACNTDVEDIAYQVESKIDFKNQEFIPVLKKVAKLLNDYAIGYTYKDNFFDYTQLLKDLKAEM